LQYWPLRQLLREDLDRVDFRRLLLFVTCSFLVVVVYTRFIDPPVPPKVENQKPAKPEDKPEENVPAEPLAVLAHDDVHPSKQIVLGSQDPQSGFQLVVYFNSRGAAIERAELVTRSGSSWKYGALEKKYGYLGYLGLSPEEGGCRVGVVADYSPAARATGVGVKRQGVQVGDLLTGINKQEIRQPVELQSYLAESTEPGQSVTLSVTRGEGDQARQLELTAELIARPLEIIDPDPDDQDLIRPSDLSCLLSFHRLGDREAKSNEVEVDSLPSLRTSDWKVHQAKGSLDEVEFHFDLDDEAAAAAGLAGGFTIIKRYRLRRQSEQAPHQGYQLDLEIEMVNRATTSQVASYRLDGPNDLPLEGWWYAHKVQPGWGGAGMRDVIWKINDRYNLRTCSNIFKFATKTPELPMESILPNRLDEQGSLKYVAVDTQFFAAGLIPVSASGEDAVSFIPQLAYTMMAEPLEQIEKKHTRTANVSFFLVSKDYEIPAKESHTDKFIIFMGPKEKETMRAYGMQDAIYYGWFGFVARPLSSILHFFYAITHNYGIAIILLTVLVRGCMFPISRKSARNAQVMQLMAPEMKKLQEKHKDDAKKKMAAQQDLFRKHNHNPLGGCLPMFLQLPIFLGLYRSIMVDISLRQAPLIPGVSWCSNLAGPDMLVQWEGFVSFLTARGSLLGPYLNILPLAAIAMIIVQQKMFMPPAQNDQQKMQQKMMKFMMIFMGVMFFKIASGLCLYFIISGVWGVAERKMLPKLDSLDQLRSTTGSSKRSSKERRDKPTKKQRSRRRRLR
jgi:YidC/Oxa1 family membrane protein insertase